MKKLQFDERDFEILKSLSENQLVGLFDTIQFFVQRILDDKRLKEFYPETVSDAVIIKETVAEECCRRNGFQPMEIPASDFFNPREVSYCTPIFYNWFCSKKGTYENLKPLDELSFIEDLKQLAFA